MASQLPTIELRGTDDDVLRGTIERHPDGSLTATRAGAPFLRQAQKHHEVPADTWARMRGFCNGPLRAVVVE